MGELVANPDTTPTKTGRQRRKVRERLFGTVVKSSGPNEYEVDFGENGKKNVKTTVLCVERLDVNVPVQENQQVQISETLGDDADGVIKVRR